MKSEKEKKVYGIGIYLSLVIEAKQAGFDDINDYVFFLKDTLAKKQAQAQALQIELAKLQTQKEA
ncbi:MAG: hypothetical protein ACP5LI_05900 [Hydrogenobaculum sp.]